MDHPVRGARALSAECQLVYRSADHAVGAEEVRNLAAAVGDWARVLELAEDAMATSTLWRLLERDAHPLVPGDVAEYLRKSATVSDFRMRHLSGRLVATLREFRRRGVPVMLLKGAAVGAMSDPTFVARPMTDLDLLVARTDLPRARESILAAGWPETKDPVLLDLLRDQHHVPPFIDPQMPDFRLELHVSLFPPDHSFALTDAELWRDARACESPFEGAVMPSAEHLLLHACLHFAWQHTMTFGAWRTFRLISGVVRSSRVDWERFSAGAHRAKGATCCHWTLRLASILSGISLPPHVLSGLSAPMPRPVGTALQRAFIAEIVPGEGPPSPSVRMTRILWLMALRPSWSGHRTPGRWDPEQRWARARGTYAPESIGARLLRQGKAYRRWWAFLTHTLRPFP